MLTITFIVAIAMVSLVAWCVPGLVLARGMYAAAVKELNSVSGPIVPPRPERPRIRESEFLHTSAPHKCAALRGDGRACNCKYRDDWVKLKNDWIDYNEWQKDYGHIKNPLTHPHTINMKPIYLAVPFWPVVAGGMYIRAGARGIPDYRAIERMELDELRELD